MNTSPHRGHSQLSARHSAGARGMKPSALPQTTHAISGILQVPVFPDEGVIIGELVGPAQDFTKLPAFFARARHEIVELDLQVHAALDEAARMHAREQRVFAAL